MGGLGPSAGSASDNRERFQFDGDEFGAWRSLSCRLLVGRARAALGRRGCGGIHVHPCEAAASAACRLRARLACGGAPWGGTTPSHCSGGYGHPRVASVLWCSCKSRVSRLPSRPKRLTSRRRPFRCPPHCLLHPSELVEQPPQVTRQSSSRSRRKHPSGSLCGRSAFSPVCGFAPRPTVKEQRRGRRGGACLGRGKGRRVCHRGGHPSGSALTCHLALLGFCCSVFGSGECGVLWWCIKSCTWFEQHVSVDGTYAPRVYPVRSLRYTP
eukprot:2942162-Prymnesium_polylepis.2